MKAFLAIFLLAAAAAATPSAGSSTDSRLPAKTKRGAGSALVPPPLAFDPFSGFPGFGPSLWNPAFAGSVWDPTVAPDLALGQVELQAAHNLALQALQDPRPGTPSIAYPPEVLRAIQCAKEANQQVQLAQHRVDEAKHNAIIQQRIALAKEASAREAAHRSAEIAAHAESEARASAKHLVALQQRLAALKDSVAAAQRLAAARETAAAAAIQRNAADTAAELRKQDVDRQISHSEREARARDLVVAKENAISNALQNNVAQKSAPAHHPWG